MPMMKIAGVVHCMREPYDVYIGRPSKWGNPYPLNGQSRGATLTLYRQYILNRPELMAALPELNGKVLGCWCSPNKCHGDILAELVRQFPYNEMHWAWYECEADCS